ncbi:MAG: GWxTD protein [Bacteroidota bacterium]|nr:GWxTD protein [Bacteroidota bacterium]
MKVIFTLLMIIFLPLATNAVQVNMEIDGAAFRTSGAEVRWEMYYSFPDTMLKYMYDDGKYSGELMIQVEIDSANKRVSENKWIVVNTVDKPLNGFKMSLIGTKSFYLLPGNYKAHIIVNDINDTATHAEITSNLTLRNYPANTFNFSDIEFASVIEHEKSKTSEWNESFHKNSLYVIPNPSLIIMDNPPKLKAYFEVYYAKSQTDGNYRLVCRIIDALNKEVFTVPQERKPYNDAIVEMIDLPLDALPTGLYMLEVLGIRNTEENADTIKVLKKFYCLNVNIPPENTAQFSENESFESSEFAAMNEDRIETEFQMAKYIASKFEIEQYDLLSTLKAKQRFMYRYWKIRDSNPETHENERLTEYRKLINYANTYFAFNNDNKGWKTDRGRIMLKYGFPAERNEHPPYEGYRGYEEWIYTSIEGGISFYFVDTRGYHKFILVHSTAYGETMNYDWYDRYVVTDPMDRSDPFNDSPKSTINQHK